MRISFDVQPLLNRKTGIAYNESFTINTLTEKYKENEYIFEFFALKKLKEKLALLKPYLKNNCSVNYSRLFSSGLYRMTRWFVPIPYKWFFGKKADVSHFFNYCLPPFVHGKTVLTVCDLVFREHPETVKFLTKISLNLHFRRSVNRADLIITVSDFTKKQLLSYYPELCNKRIEKVLIGVDTNFYKKQETDVVNKILSKYNIDGDYILYLGTIEPRKNLVRLIEAYAGVIKTDKDAPLLVIAGMKGWLYGNIFKTVKQLGMEKNVVFTEYIPDSDKPALLSGAKMFCFPSLYEGFGMPPLEAMACGTPVLTSNTSSLPEICGDAAFYIDPFSVSEIEHGIRTLCHDEELRTELIKKGRERVKLFAWDVIAEQLYGLYEELVNNKEDKKFIKEVRA